MSGWGSQAHALERVFPFRSKSRRLYAASDLLGEEQMELGLTGKKALVTGDTHGIGRAIAGWGV